MVGLFLATFLASTLLLSSGFKVLRPAKFLDGLRSYPALNGLGSFQMRALGVVVTVAELGAGFLLLLPRLVLLGAIASGLLFGAFYALIARDGRAYISNCGCWGGSPAVVPKGAYLFRNLVLSGCSLLLVFILTASGLPPSWPVLRQLAALAMSVPFALLALEAPQIGQVVALRTREPTQ